MTNHSSILAKISPMDRGAWRATVMIEATYHAHVVRIMYLYIYINTFIYIYILIYIFLQ